MYCVRCGDKIEKDELVCDKCGLSFAIVAKDNTLVYINQTPDPIVQNQNNVQSPIGSVQNQNDNIQNTAASVQTQSNINQNNNIQSNINQTVNTPAQIQNIVNPGAVNQSNVNPIPVRNNVNQTVKAATPVNSAGKPANKKVKNKKEKKFRFGWIIALASIASVILVVVLGSITLIAGALIGVWLFSDDGSSQVVVNDLSQTQNTAPAVNVVTHQNTNISEQSDYFSSAIRDRFVTLKGDGTDTVTVMIYMNGSDLESKYGYATEDLKEILNATLSDNVNVVIQTGGTKKWDTAGITPKHSQRFVVKDGQLVLIDDSLEQLDITRGETLQDFISFASTAYPADRNILIFWNHGGGVVYGYGVDEHVTDEYAALTMDEIQQAISNTNVKFEMIGFDACLMGGLETACVLYDVADYLVVSEDFEPGSGWEYQNWLSLLGYNSSTPMTDVGKVIVDDFIKESISEESQGILALIDLRYTRLLYSAWTDFAFANEDELLSYDYTMSMQRSERANDAMFKKYAQRDFFDWFYSSETMETYCYAVDIMALASTKNTDEANALATVMRSVVLYCSSTEGDSYMTGLSVTLPYDDPDFYDELREVFVNCGFDSTYIEFLSKFAYASGLNSYDWNSSDFNGWDYYDDSSYWNDYNWDDYDWDSYYSNDYNWDCYDYGDDWYYDDGYYGDWYYDDSYYDDGYYYNW
ncbi:MAG: hypothetical protein K5776_02010 [Lachnospiraceae bacterium]|nr:hypothetical protein [Lachnospiraceae bacterium]